MKKVLLIVVPVVCVAILAVLGVVFFSGGNDSESHSSSSEEIYTVNVQYAENGNVSVDRTSAKSGEMVTLTVEPNEGYELESLIVNGNSLTVTNGNATFVMPNNNVEVTYSFKPLTFVIESVPGINLFSIEATSVRENAKGYWTVTFGSEALEITVWVEDSFSFPDYDGIKVYFGKTGYDRNLGENNVAVQVLQNGSIITYMVENGNYVESELDGFSANVWDWSNTSANTKIGFKVKLNVLYSALGTTSENAKGNITMIPSQTNKNYDTIAPMETIVSGCELQDPRTYLLLTDNNLCKENPMKGVTAQLGKISNADAGIYWDCSMDYFPDEEEYDNRKVILTGHDNGDNNIYFFNTAGGNQMYAEATFKVTSLYNPNEAYGKFGLMFFNGSSQSGLFYYVDAFIGDDVLSTINIKGTELGYNQATGGWGSWNTIPDTQNSFNLTTKTITLKMAYKNDLLYLYLGDQLVLTKSQTATKYATIGIKSFGYGLEVTDYYATKDANDPKLIAHTPNETQKEIDLLFLGDDYVDGWADYKTTDITASKAKETISGSKVADWNTNISAIKSAYKPQNIIMSVGLNDIKTGSSAQTTFDAIKNLVSNYHTQFPNVKLYWISIIPSPDQSNNSAFRDLNTLIKNYSQSDNLLEYIDIASAFTLNGGVRPNMFGFSDGTYYLNTEFGYPLWGKTLIEALGYTRSQGEALGDNDDGYAYTNGWSFESNGTIAVNSGTGEQVIWSNQMHYASDLYFEAEIHAPENTGADSYPKAGLAIRNDEYTIFAYVDFSLTSGSNCMMNIVYRGNSKNASGDWDWNNQGNGGYAKSNVSNYVKLAIAKFGNVVYMLCEDVIVATFEVPGVNADDEFVAGLLNFNRKMYVKNAVAITDKAEVAEKLQVEYIPEVNMNDANALGSDKAEHDTSNLTYKISVYEKQFDSDKAVDYARLYLVKTGGYVAYVNGTELVNVVTAQQQGNNTVFVYDVKNMLTNGVNALKIATADENTKVTCKLVIGYTDQAETVVVSDSTWVKTSGEIIAQQKPNLYFLGSSVTYGSANNGVSFVEKIQSKLGYTCVKQAVSGTTLVDNGSDSYIQRMKNNILSTENVDHLVVQLSTNDVTQNKPFGELSSGTELSSFNTATVIGAIEYIIAYAKQTWDCEVSFYTNPDFNNVSYKALISELYKVQKKWGIGILDFYNYVDMQALDSNTLSGYMSDAIHPNDNGYVWMSGVFSEYLQNAFEKTLIKKYIG